jgi:hypothetical protein
MIVGPLASLHHEHDLALNVSAIGPLVEPASFGKRKGAVNRNADRTVVKQVPDFLQLRATRSDLRCGNRDAQLRSRLGTGEPQGEDWK